MRAVRRLTIRNPNPYDGEPFYNLGLARFYQGRDAEAYDAFHKAVWNHAWQSAGYYALASISTGRGDSSLALEQVEQSLLTNVVNLKARALKASLLRRMGRASDAKTTINESLLLDRLDFRMMAERFLLTRADEDLSSLYRCPEWRHPNVARCFVRSGMVWPGRRFLHFIAGLRSRDAMAAPDVLVHAFVARIIAWLGAGIEPTSRASRIDLAPALLSSPSGRNDCA